MEASHEPESPQVLLIPSTADAVAIRLFLLRTSQPIPSFPIIPNLLRAITMNQASSSYLTGLGDPSLSLKHQNKSGFEDFKERIQSMVNSQVSSLLPYPDDKRTMISGNEYEVTGYETHNEAGKNGIALVGDRYSIIASFDGDTIDSVAIEVPEEYKGYENQLIERICAIKFTTEKGESGESKRLDVLRSYVAEKTIVSHVGNAFSQNLVPDVELNATHHKLLKAIAPKQSKQSLEEDGLALELYVKVVVEFKGFQYIDVASFDWHKLFEQTKQYIVLPGAPSDHIVG
jgi:hypothetical protein